MEWYRWIAHYQATIHDTDTRTVEKLAILQQHLRGNCRILAAQVSGSGEEEYKEVLRQLKITCGRKDIMRLGHIQVFKLLNPKKRRWGISDEICDRGTIAPLRPKSTRRRLWRRHHWNDVRKAISRRKKRMEPRTKRWDRNSRTKRLRRLAERNSKQLRRCLRIDKGIHRTAVQSKRSRNNRIGK